MRVKLVIIYCHFEVNLSQNFFSISVIFTSSCLFGNTECLVEVHFQRNIQVRYFLIDQKLKVIHLSVLTFVEYLMLHPFSQSAAIFQSILQDFTVQDL